MRKPLNLETIRTDIGRIAWALNGLSSIYQQFEDSHSGYDTEGRVTLSGEMYALARKLTAGDLDSPKELAAVGEVLEEVQKFFDANRLCELCSFLEQLKICSDVQRDVELEQRRRAAAEEVLATTAVGDAT